jgi:HNH endonuclease
MDLRSELLLVLIERCALRFEHLAQDGSVRRGGLKFCRQNGYTQLLHIAESRAYTVRPTRDTSQGVQVLEERVMTFTNAELRWIYDRTTGYCHLCQKKRAFTNYGRPGRKGAWEVEHSRAQAHGGTHRLNNLYAACIPCNREKGVRSTKSVRTQNGYTKAPLSRVARTTARSGNALGGALLGALPGAAFLGPAGFLVGALVGAALGYDSNPDRD